MFQMIRFWFPPLTSFHFFLHLQALLLFRMNIIKRQKFFYFHIFSCTFGFLSCCFSAQYWHSDVVQELRFLFESSDKWQMEK